MYINDSNLFISTSQNRHTSLHGNGEMSGALKKVVLFK